MTTPIDRPFAAPRPGAVTGAPRALLRLEALGALALLLVAYGMLGGSWARFALLFLAPDLSFLGYLAGPRVGAFLYNATHSLLGPAALAGASAIVPALLPFAVIWAAHVAFDRALGYGLKHELGFRHTHLGTLGRPATPRATP